ncbi:MAG TPA: M20/M25/M40 family metallo-hydrolase [Vicinamibacterales bacterium]|nr:M20/M25/M40 family metallo-hydrolase [Vicinamibacterales bacterium]
MDPLPLLRDLVAVNSVNPSLVPGAPGEAQAAEVARAAMAAAGLDVVLQEAAPGRPNVVGVLDGRTTGPSLMFCGHLDTVGVEGMTTPFVPRVEDGRLYARGAQDMKGGVASMIAAAAILARSWTRGTLIVAAVVDEEYESLGAEALVRDWHADAAIITEPTDLRLAIGHKGFAWLEIVTHGRAAHGSRPEDGRDAIARMGRVLGALEGRDRELRARPPAPFQGTGSLHASLISGGHELSSYPDRCTLEMERRTVAEEDGPAVLQEVNAILDRLKRDDPEFRAETRLVTYRPPHRLDAAHPLVTSAIAALGRAGRPAEPTGMSFWTDAAILAAAGTPSVLFGPGGAGLHSTSEFVIVEDLYTCRDVLVDVTRSWCAGT